MTNFIRGILSRLALYSLLAVLFCCLETATSLVQAQTFSVSPTQIEVGDRDVFELSYRLEGASISDFQAPSFADFSVVGGPSKSTSIQIINGRMSGMASVSYTLQPKRTGTFSIPSATVTTDQKKVLRSEKVTVKVSKGTHQAKPQSPSSGGRQSQTFPPFGGVMPPPNYPDNGDTDIFVRLVPDTTQVYQGEQALLSMRVYTTRDVADFNLLTPPAFTSFWVEDITDNSSTKSHKEKINDTEYTVFDVKNYALFPQQVGKFLIPPVEAEVSVQASDPNWGNLFYRTQTLRLQSDSAVLQVNDLPEAGKPADFSGSVGVFTLSAHANTQQLRTGEPFELQVLIAGEGNIKLLQQPEIAFPKQIEAYDPQVTEDIAIIKNGRISGRKFFEYSLMPIKTGEATIPPISFSYYDTQLRQYRTLQTEPINLRIAQGAQSPSQAQNPDSADNDATTTTTQSTKSYALPILAALLISGLAIWVYYRRRTTTNHPDIDLYTGSPKGNATHKRPTLKALQQAQSQLNKGDIRAFYDQTHHALSEYLTQQFGLAHADLSPDHLRETLLQHLSESDAQGIAKLMQQCEIALFAPISIPIGEAQQHYEQAIALISHIENNRKTAQSR
ncbi:MAG: protein BatD [Sphingobacteriales bacterium]|nr:protein BatD [Sphingobacteriales bacterium]